MSRETFTLTFRDAGASDRPPAVVRLRRLLKHALRALALRCVAATGDGGAGGRAGRESSDMRTAETDARLAAALDELAGLLDGIACAAVGLGEADRRRAVAMLRPVAAGLRAVAEEAASWQ